MIRSQTIPQPMAFHLHLIAGLYLVFKAITTLMGFQKHAFSFRMSTLKCTETTEFHAVT